MNRELTHKIADASDVLDNALLMADLIWSAALENEKENRALCYGTDRLSDLIKDANRQLASIRAELRETPVMAKYREYMAARKIFVDAADDPDQDDQPLYDELTRIENEMHVLPSLTPKDMAVKMVVAHGYGDHTCLDYDGEAWAEARALAG